MPLFTATCVTAKMEGNEIVATVKYTRDSDGRQVALLSHRGSNRLAIEAAAQAQLAALKQADMDAAAALNLAGQVLATIS